MQPNKLRTGIIFIGLGVALLLYNLDRLDSDYFGSLLELWPVLLIALGIEVLARHSEVKVLGYVSPLLIAGTFLYAGTRDGGWYNVHTSWGSSDSERMQTTEREFRVDSPVNQARYFVDLNSGRLHIASGGDQLGRGTFKARGKVRTSITDDEGVAVVRVRQSGASRDDAEFDMYLSPQLPLTLDLKAHDAEVELEAEELSVQTLFLELARGNARLSLGRELDSVWAHLDLGSARLTVRIPAEAGVRLEGSDLPEEFKFDGITLLRADSALETSGYGSAPLRFIFDLAEAPRDLKFEAY